MIPLFKVYIDPSAKRTIPLVFDSGYVGQGPRVEEFEHALTETLNLPLPLLTTNSCTSALHLALHLCGAGPSTDVISTPITCTATNSSVVALGATIVWADVDPKTGLISPASVKSRITPRTKAIIAVDWAGQPCNYKELKKVANGIPIIQDSAHGVGNTGGDYSCYSFQAIKHLTTGDGGALLCPTKAIYDRVKLLRWYGLDRTSTDSFRCAQEISEVGYKFHLNDIAATIGLANLPGLKDRLTAHYENAEIISRVVGGTGGRCSWGSHPNWVLTIHSAHRDELQAFLVAAGITSSPVHARNDAMPGFQKHTAPPGQRSALPGVDSFSRTQLCIPCGWWLTNDETTWISKTLMEWYTRYES